MEGGGFDLVEPLKAAGSRTTTSRDGLAGNRVEPSSEKPLIIPPYRGVITGEKMSSALEELYIHISMKIKNIKRSLPLRNLGQDPAFQETVGKVLHEMSTVHFLLDKIENELKEQEKQKSALKDLRKSADKQQDEAVHLKENVPPNLPKPDSCCAHEPEVKTKEDKAVKSKVGKTECAKKDLKHIKEISHITLDEFYAIPMYIRGRLTFEQINTVVVELNKALVSKYSILHQPQKMMNSSTRSLYNRFMEEEIKETKGKFFIVEADILQFTELKMEKRFHSIMSILRHCQRLRQVRSSKIIRYILY